AENEQDRRKAKKRIVHVVVSLILCGLLFGMLTITGLVAPRGRGGSPFIITTANAALDRPSPINVERNRRNVAILGFTISPTVVDGTGSATVEENDGVWVIIGEETGSVSLTVDVYEGTTQVGSTTRNVNIFGSAGCIGDFDPAPGGPTGGTATGDWWSSPPPPTLTRDVNGPPPLAGNHPAVWRWPLVNRTANHAGQFAGSHPGIDPFPPNQNSPIFAPAGGMISVRRHMVRGANNATNSTQAYFIRIDHGATPPFRTPTSFFILYSTGSPAYSLVGGTWVRNANRPGMPGIRQTPLMNGSTIPISTNFGNWFPSGLGGQGRTTPWIAGTRVERGEVIGHTGSGHIHYEIWGGTDLSGNWHPYRLLGGPVPTGWGPRPTSGQLLPEFPSLLPDNQVMQNQRIYCYVQVEISNFQMITILDTRRKNYIAPYLINSLTMADTSNKL
ncbi:MAG: hypothetical protein FWE16_03610, partial [Firmicutes bacterium]|nr:hypothetical protein [Bacillota bacterium]